MSDIKEAADERGEPANEHLSEGGASDSEEAHSSRPSEHGIGSFQSEPIFVDQQEEPIFIETPPPSSAAEFIRAYDHDVDAGDNLAHDASGVAATADKAFSEIIDDPAPHDSQTKNPEQTQEETGDLGARAHTPADATTQPNADAQSAPTHAPASATTTGKDVLTANVGDQPSPLDTLGFAPYVQAIASFLTNDVTKPPLTLSIEGEWGSGKSSFMLQLENELKRRGAKVVKFNAWRHDKDDALWAAFALQFTHELARQLGWRERWRAKLKLFARRFDWSRGWRDAARVAALVALLVVVILIPFLFPQGTITQYLSSIGDGKGAWWTPLLKGTVGVGGFVGYLSVVLLLAIKLKDFVGDPFSINLQQHLDAPDYKSRVAFIERFHEDFAKVVETYAPEQKVYVFIDDLDRCEVPKAADLMQALNLMISDATQLVFIMGMDREKVAAGLAVKYEKLLPYLAPAPAGDGTRAAPFDPVLGLEYGYNFIEKFIQLPFIIPQAGADRLDDFLDKIFDDGKDEAKPASSPPPRSTVRGRKAEARVTEDTKMVKEVLKLVAPTFEYNPRKLKQFINAFRLKTFIASRAGLFDTTKDPTRYDPLKPQQLAKFVAISLRWPLLLADLDAERDLLVRLQRAALNWGYMNECKRAWKSAIESGDYDHKMDALMRWLARDSLLRFLRAGMMNVNDAHGAAPSELISIYSLEKLDVNSLLQVTPIARAAIPPPAANKNGTQDGDPISMGNQTVESNAGGQSHAL